jgi:hypothetical protein
MDISFDVSHTNRHMGREEDGYITYGAFRNFLMLLPPERRKSDLDASLAWFEAATFVPLMPPVRKGASGATLVMAAVAGGLASGTSTATMHPLDTIKTQVRFHTPVRQKTPGQTCTQHRT